LICLGYSASAESFTPISRNITWVWRGSLVFLTDFHPKIDEASQPPA
jgi:hypothetical protein